MKFCRWQNLRTYKITQHAKSILRASCFVSWLTGFHNHTHTCKPAVKYCLQYRLQTTKVRTNIIKLILKDLLQQNGINSAFQVHKNSLPLGTFANSLDPDQARHFVGPDLDPNCLTPWWYVWKKFSKKLMQTTKTHEKLLGLIWIKNCLTPWWYSWKNFSKKLMLKKISRWQKRMKNYPACKVYIESVNKRKNISHHCLLVYRYIDRNNKMKLTLSRKTEIYPVREQGRSCTEQRQRENRESP